MFYLLLFVAVLFIPVKFRIYAYTGKDNLSVQTEVVLFKGASIIISKSKVTVKKVLSSLFSGKKGKFTKTQIFRYLLKKAKIKRLNVFASIGGDNAAQTAIASGQIFGILAPIAANLAKKGDYNVDIKPNFEEKCFNFSGECIFKMNVVHTLITIFKIVRGK